MLSLLYKSGVLISNTNFPGSSPYYHWQLMYSLLPPTLLNLALATPPLGQSLLSSGCPATGPISCQDTGGTTGSCCYESPGVRCCFPISWGVVNQSLMTLLDFRVCCCKLRHVYSAWWVRDDLILHQFWDTRPSTGPVDSWTIHGK